MADYHGAASEGTRAQNLMKKREKQKEELEKLKQKIADVSLSGYGTRSPYVQTVNRMCARTFVYTRMLEAEGNSK